MSKRNPKRKAPPPSVPDDSDSDSDSDSSSSQSKIIFLLDDAKLETVKTRKGDFELLNCDDHRDLCRKWKKDPKMYRPDITHQMLLTLIDSPLNKCGRMQIYIRTSSNVLIYVHPSIRIPRTFKRFSGLMVQLLHKMKIKSTTGTTLLKVIRNDFGDKLGGCRCVGLEVDGDLYSPSALARQLLTPLSSSSSSSSSNSTPSDVAFVLGAMASDNITSDRNPYITDVYKISEYNLSGAAAA
eukprot:CAMPEP_0118658386 /NCGR_PEP_ID=MMETSP0785-20121206/14539_1 /TAXON_ID=91992 /ORGANISM="Bolidomonas pacifica, Strain CCMP 1866" /LENGTH=239 /DNA_ID=CAMNT_0006551397 /DNA_START=93 /DNA_END=809 /DNA_ORIENTATION=+